jgi:hypothetical protein
MDGAARQYVYGVTGLTAIVDPEDVLYYPIKDHLGSVREVVNADNHVVADYEFNAFGELFRSEMTVGVRYMFTGQEFNEDTGIFNYRAR